MSDTSDQKSNPVVGQISQSVQGLRQDGVGSRWIVAVSGGADSVGLLRALHALRIEHGLELSVAHLDHGVRGEASRSDAMFVENLAKQIDLPFRLGHWSPQRQNHFEADARAARYSWLTQLAQESGFDAIAVAHTRDDQAETILHRIVRGTGINGLSGISLRRELAPGVSLVRPALGVRRALFLSYLESLDQPHCFDASNGVLNRTRNCIRLDLLPKLASEYNPEVVEALARLGDISRAMVDARLTELVEIEQLVVKDQGAGHVTFDGPAFRKLAGTTRVELVRHTWKRLGLPEQAMTARAWLQIAEFSDRTDGRLTLPGGVTFSTFLDSITLRRTGSEPTPEHHSEPDLLPIPLPIPGKVIHHGLLTLTYDPDDTCSEIIDADRLVLPLRIDSPRPGDRFEPLGMGGRSMPLNDFLRGRGIRKEARAQVLVLKDALGVVWVVGQRIADRVRVTDQTTRRLGLRWVAPDPSGQGESEVEPTCCD